MNQVMSAFSDVSGKYTSKILVSKKLVGATFYLFDNRIYLISIHEYSRVTMELVNTGIQFLLDNGDGGKYYNIFQFRSFSDTEPEVREWASGHKSNRISMMDAVVISNLSHKIIADFYMKFSKPKLPTKVFTDLNKAFDWLEKGIEKDKLDAN